MTNARKESRKKLMAFTPVYELRHKTLLGYVADLTLKGAMVSGEKSAGVNEHMVLGIEFPEAPPTMAAVRVVIPVRVAWCRKEDGSNFSIGFEFAEVSPENLKTLDAIIQRYQFRSVSEPSSL